MRKIPACTIIVLALLIGDGALIAFMIFAFAGPPRRYRPRPGVRQVNAQSWHREEIDSQIT